MNIYLCYFIEVTLITFNATLIYNIFVIKFIISLVVFLNIWLTHCNGFFFQVLQHVLKGLFPISLSLQISFYDLSFFFSPLYYYFMLVWSTYLSVGMDQKLKLDIWFFFFFLTSFILLFLNIASPTCNLKSDWKKKKNKKQRYKFEIAVWVALF